MEFENEILIIIITIFIISEIIFNAIFLFFIFKFTKNKKQRSKIITLYSFISLVTILFIVLAIVHLLGFV